MRSEEYKKKETIDQQEKRIIKNAFSAVKQGLMSTKQFAQKTGKAIAIGGRRDYSKYTGRDLRIIRQRNGEGRPNFGTAKQMNEVHDAWYLKKFGTLPQDY